MIGHIQSRKTDEVAEVFDWVHSVDRLKIARRLVDKAVAVGRSVDLLLEECREIEQLGLPGVILFGLPDHKDATGSEATAATGYVQRGIEAIRKAKLNLLVITGSGLILAAVIPLAAREIRNLIATIKDEPVHTAPISTQQ